MTENKNLNPSKGGKARANILSKEERSLIARTAAKARWGEAKLATVKPKADHQEKPAALALPYSMFRGSVTLGKMEIEGHVLSDGRRVLTQREVVRVISGGRESGDLGGYLDNNPLFNKDLVLGAKISFQVPGTQLTAHGYEATLLVDICDRYIEADELGLLKHNQKKLAKQAAVILRSCAKVGIIALIDEATGYQEVRAKNALQLKLQAFIADELQDWARAFPTDFWLELARLEGVHYSPRSRPLRWGRYIMMFVYDAIDPEVGQMLRQKNPNPHFKSNHHQWLKQFGKDKLHDQLQKVITIMKLCDSMDEFRKQFARVFKKTPVQMEFADLID